jgi:hypothetical protein
MNCQGYFDGDPNFPDMLGDEARLKRLLRATKERADLVESKDEQIRSLIMLVAQARQDVMEMTHQRQNNERRF